MNLLIVSATFQEIEPTFDFLKIERQSNKNFYKVDFIGNEISILIAGIGSYSTVYNLTKLLIDNKFDLIINIGIAGSFDENLRIGDIVIVKTETIGDLGINDNGTFKTVFDVNFLKPDSFPFQENKLINNFDLYDNKLTKVKTVNALTVNTVSGETNQIEYLKNKFDVQVESMEGAGVFYVCLQENIKFIELRAISNYVKPRNKEKWETMLAISNLNNKLKFFIFELLK
ncbi:MAG: futalosine hydrolase [Bacteroidales bacterium]|nr:futalosine hydrolase [Bacteroidales bacterium]